MADLILHVGLMKSGTTSVQQVMGARRDQLAAHGVYYPDQGQAHQMLAFVHLLRSDPEARVQFHPGLARHINELKLDTAAQWRDLQRRVLEAPVGRVVLSAENLIYAGAETRSQIRAAFPEHSIKIVVTHRAASKMLPSNYQQQARVARIGDFETWTRRELERLCDPDGGGSLRSLRIREFSEKWGEIGPVSLIRVGDDHAQGLRTMWSELVGYALPDDLTSVPSRNQSFPAELIEATQRFLRQRDAMTVAQVREAGKLALARYAAWVGDAGFRWKLSASLADELDAQTVSRDPNWSRLLSVVEGSPLLGRCVPPSVNLGRDFGARVDRAEQELRRAARVVAAKTLYREVRTRVRP